MSDTDDLIELLDDEAPFPPASGPTRWKVAIVDDDLAVHSGTRFALYDYFLNGQGLDLISAHSAAEGRELLAAHPDTAVVLLDVVMESDTAGLELVEYIRGTLRNETVRIILRTGQPGQAPERRVIVDYDINDYKAKTELTADKLFTALTAAIRSYQQLLRLVQTRRGLEIIVEAASTLFDVKSMQRLAAGVLEQIAALLDADCAGALVSREGGAGAPFRVLAASGIYAGLDGTNDTPPAELAAAIEATLSARAHDLQPQRACLYLATPSGREIVIALEVGRPLGETDRTLVEVFCSRLSVAFDNVLLYEQLQEANRRLEARVTERTQALKAANKRLASNRDRLKRANTYKNELLGKVAHDLKNPLGVILGRTEIMEELVAGPAAAAAGLNAQIGHIRDAATRLIGMAETLISDAMADAEDIALRRERFDAAVLLREVIDANRPNAARKDLALEVTAPTPLPIVGDVERLREAFDNLVSNAIKYTPAGGAVDVEGTLAADAVRIVVRDSGPGLSPEDATRLFGRFQRLSAKPTGGESSTGLGLWIAKRIVDLHEGRISGESRSDGKGSLFTIELPASGPGAP